MIRLGWFLELAALRLAYLLVKLLALGSCVAIVLWILRLDVTQSVLTGIRGWIQSNRELFGVILGAFLASSTGYAAQLLLDRRREAQQLRRSARLLKSDIQHLLLKVRLLEHSLRQDFGDPEKKLRFIQSPRCRIDWIPNWFEHLSDLGHLMPSDYAARIRGIYCGAEDIRASVAAGDLQRASEVVVDLLSHDTSRKLIEDLAPTSEELIEDLGRLAATGRVRDWFWREFWNGITFRIQLKAVRGEIEDEIVGVLSEKGRIELGEVLDHMDAWLSEKDQSFQRRYRERWRRLVFRVVMDSKRISICWNEVWLSTEAAEG